LNLQDSSSIEEEEDEEPEIKEVLDLKTSLENVDPKKQNRGRSTRFENLFGERRSEEEESRARGENRERRSIGIGKVNGGTRVLKPRVPSGFFPHQLSPLVTRVLKSQVLSYNSSF